MKIQHSNKLTSYYRDYLFQIKLSLLLFIFLIGWSIAHGAMMVVRLPFFIFGIMLLIHAFIYIRYQIITSVKFGLFQRNSFSIFLTKFIFTQPKTSQIVSMVHIKYTGKKAVIIGVVYCFIGIISLFVGYSAQSQVFINLLR
jgi:hypothetical protein